MKVLVLDEDTTKMVSMVYSQSEILEQEVFLVEKLDTRGGEQLFHLKVPLRKPKLEPGGTIFAVSLRKHKFEHK